MFWLISGNVRKRCPSLVTMMLPLSGHRQKRRTEQQRSSQVSVKVAYMENGHSSQVMKPKRTSISNAENEGRHAVSSA
jgi:hypothetical protein